jgi:hypothetical protein
MGVLALPGKTPYFWTRRVTKQSLLSFSIHVTIRFKQLAGDFGDMAGAGLCYVMLPG